jgi:dTMP kinase
MPVNDIGLPAQWVLDRIRPPLSLRQSNYPGKLIAFCGVDGAGKTTIIEATAEYFRQKGKRVTHTQIPTARVRNDPIFRSFIDDARAEVRDRVDFLALQLTVMADLLQHVRDTILPRLQSGDTVLCDRYVFTPICEARARSPDVEIETICAQIAGRVPKPDICILLDVSPETARRRVQSRPEERDSFLDLDLLVNQVTSYRAVARENGLLFANTEADAHLAFRSIRETLDRCEW